MSLPNTRQALYDRIAKSSKEEVIVEEMIRLGFWRSTGMPTDPAAEIKRRGELLRQVEALRNELTNMLNVAKVKRELYRKRLADSREAQKQTKIRREQQRLGKLERWIERKERELLFLGPEVSKGLSVKPTDSTLLTAIEDRFKKWFKLDDESKRETRQKSLQVPLLRTPLDLAKAMNITLGELRFLSYARTVSKRTHYVRFSLPKKLGGVRVISAPMKRLKRAQHWILQHVLSPLRVHTAAHGFVKNRSIVSNATPHIGKKVVINIDLKDFFPTVEFQRVKGLFRALGYAEPLSIVLALLTTEPDVDAIEHEGSKYFIALGKRFLPQGAPTSPAITNLLCYRLDQRLQGLAKKFGYTYTRYADDLTFSSPSGTEVHSVLHFAEKIVKEEGFNVHPDKVHVQRSSRKQEVTGVVVNRKASIDKRTVHRFRALIHQIERSGPDGKAWSGSGNVIEGISGFAQYFSMVDPKKAAPYVIRVHALVQKYGVPKRKVQTPAPEAPQPTVEQPSAEPAVVEKPIKKWWKLF